MDRYLLELDSADCQAVIDALHELYRARDLAAFPRVALRVLRRLVPTVFSSYNELNLRTGGVVTVFDPEEALMRVGPYLSLIAQYESQHPLLMQYQTTGAGDAQTISDFVTWDEWQKREIYRNVMKPIGVGESMSFAVHSSTLTLAFFVLSRELPDFTPRDRAVCNLLRPHLTQALENAQTFTAARAVATLVTGAISTLQYGLVIADSEGHVRHANDFANELLDRYFPGPAEQPRKLPNVVIAWLKENLRNALLPITPFRLGRSEANLRVRLAERETDCVLLLEETGPQPDARRLVQLGLSPREAEVLYWVTQGKSNEQVASILGISRRTIDKHLENVYTKLGVEARGPAMCLAAAALGRDDA